MCFIFLLVALFFNFDCVSFGFEADKRKKHILIVVLVSCILSFDVVANKSNARSLLALK